MAGFDKVQFVLRAERLADVEGTKFHRVDENHILMEGLVTFTKFPAAIVVSIDTAALQWAAYIGGYPDELRSGMNIKAILSHIASHGVKLRPEEAEGMFPEILIPYRL